MAKTIRALVALIAVSFLGVAVGQEKPPADEKKAIRPSTAYLPMAVKGQIATPKELATRIRGSLKQDASGNGRVQGANITPVGFLTAVKKAGAPVDGVQALPAYLDSLIDREMPTGMLTMSRVKYTRDTKGVEEFTLDVEKGFTREAHKGERGWFDANTGNFILAGDCSNSPLVPVKGPVATPKETPVAQATPAPATIQKTGPCPARSYFVVDISKTEVLDLVSGLRDAVAEEAKKAPGSHGEGLRVSVKFHDELFKLAKWSTTGYEVSVNLLKADGTSRQLFSGVVTGQHFMHVPADFAKGDRFQVVPKDSSVFASPFNTLEVPENEVKACRTHGHFIEGKKWYLEKKTDGTGTAGTRQ